ncbi:MAG: molybdopterin-dependent oxidoreductase [Actinobacteria bacterium]|nr:molybdopterin-dependent oxidoreductase [Actinomycetota bacterium]
MRPGSQPVTPGSERTRNDLRRAGALATAVALGGMWTASALIPSSVFPPAAVADAVIRFTPGDVATFFIESLGHWAMRLLAVGVLAAVVVLGAQVLVWTRMGAGPRPFVAGAVLAGLAALLFLVPPVTGSDVATIVVGAIGGLVYALAARSLLESRTEEGDDVPVDATRRSFLRIGTGGAIALATTGGVVGWLARKLEGPDTNVTLVPPAARAEVPARGDFPDIPGLSREVTPVPDHYVVDINLLQPSVDATGWKLEVFGEVEKPLTLDFAQLQQRFDVVEEFSVLSCISNEVGGDLIGNSAWGGVRLRDVLEAAGVKPGGTELVLRAADGYSDSFPVELGMDESVLLAVSQNGRPLTQEHGFPCRVRIPRLYGMENVKWLESIEVVRSDYAGYWQQRGWKDTAEVRTQSRIDVAGEDSKATLGKETWIAGVAWAGARGVAKVEVSTDDGGTWAEAQLKDPVADNAWRLWAYRWTPIRRGEATIVCRATDGDGDVQTAELAPPHPAGATGWHSVKVKVEA